MSHNYSIESEVKITIPFVFERLQMLPKCLGFSLQLLSIQVINIEWLTTFSKNFLLSVTFGTTALLAFLMNNYDYRYFTVPVRRIFGKFETYLFLDLV